MHLVCFLDHLAQKEQSSSFVTVFVAFINKLRNQMLITVFAVFLWTKRDKLIKPMEKTKEK